MAKKRIFGDKINFKSLSCAPINEMGVVYLFGMLHDVLDFKIESIQAGFPDCIARRQITKTRWEELRIEFEYESRSFVTHKHDPDEVDMIICWRHNWKDCPEWIEVIELSSLINNMEDISEEVAGNEKKLTEYQQFCREKRLEGLEFKEIAKLWQKMKTRQKGEKDKREDDLEDTSEKKKLTEYQQFCREKRLEGLDFREISNLWKKHKEKGK